MTPDEKFSLIVRNLKEHYGDEYILKILQEISSCTGEQHQQDLLIAVAFGSLKGWTLIAGYFGQSGS